jgi:hypothetical protein
MILDLRFDGKLGMELSQRMGRVAEEIRIPFHDLIGRLSKGNETNLDWWVSAPPSRNTYASPFFHHCCCIRLVQDLLAEKIKIDSILVDSSAVQKILAQIFAGKETLPEIQISDISLLKKSTLWLIKKFLTPLNFFYSHWQAKDTGYEKKSIPPDTILIDVFVQDYSIDTEVYYPGLLDFLSEEEKQKIFFVPTLYKISPSRLKDTYKALRNSNKNYLLKEDFLKWEDYFYAWGYVLRSLFLEIPSVHFSGVNVKPLVVEEIRSLKEIGPAMTALLNYRFSHRLKEKGIVLKLVVNWFENQIVDKGWNAGFRKYYPEIETIGYMGFLLPRHQHCIFPTALEENSKIIPKKIQVMGEGIVAQVKEHAPDLKVGTAPAFRYSYIWNRSKKKIASEKFFILVPFPILIDKAVEILHRIHDMYKILDDKSMHFLFKMHPTCSEQDILKNIPFLLPQNFQFVEGKLEQWLENSQVLISAGSGVLMEAIASQVPVIIIGSSSGLTHHTIPEDLDPLLWKICYTSEELAKSMVFYKNKDPNDLRREFKLADGVIKNYFRPVDEQGVRDFLQMY